MASFLHDGPRWLRGWLGRRTPPAPFPGETTVLRTQDALAMLEEALGARVVEASHAAVVAGLSGMALSGERIAGFAPGASLAAAGPVLREAVVRRTPLVLHAVIRTLDDRAGVDAAIGAGALVAIAHDPQHAVDLTLVARRVAEDALVPVVVFADGNEVADTSGPLRMAEPALLADYLGAAGDRVPCRTPAQTLLFGADRRRVPAWLDPDRPAAHGVPPTDEQAAAVLAGREAFFGEPVPALLREALAALSDRTGRTVGLVTDLRPRGARHLVVTEGGLVAAAREAAAEAHAEIKADIGVVSVDWLAPRPDVELGRALAGARSITVLERGDDGPGGPPPLLRAVREAAGADGPPVVQARCAPGTSLRAGELARLFLRTARGEGPARPVHLGVDEAAGSAYPKREVLLQSLRRALPDLPGEAAPDKNDAAPSRHPDPGAPAEAPLAARRFAHGEPTYDSVPRAWGELVEPLRAGEPVAQVPDPRSALGAVPPATADLFAPGETAARLPVIDPAACVGCGACWALCPDTAIAPLALGTEAWLDAAADRAGRPATDAAAAKLKRAHKQLAARLDGMLAKQELRALTPSTLREAYDWLADKMQVTGDERDAMDAAFEATAQAFGSVVPAATPPLFHDAHAGERGSGALLFTAVDPQVCKGCGLCAAECPEDAITLEAHTAERAADAHEGVRLWEALPDTPGKVVARARAHRTVGPLAAVLLSRHCLMSVTGGDPGEAGSGQRVAVRQVAATVEHAGQVRVAAHVKRLDELIGRLHEAVRGAVTGSLPLESLAPLDEALQAVPDRQGNASELVSRLEALGVRDHLDVPRVRRLLRAARALETQRQQLALGRRGQGRARFGVVLAGASVVEWAARYPQNPFVVPTVVDTSGTGAALASGLALGWLDQRVDEARAVRWAELLLDSPPDLAVREEALADLDARGLTEEERALCPPVLLVAGPDAFEARGLGDLSHLLSGEVPVKVLLLDDRAPGGLGTDPTLFALAHRTACVTTTSIAHPAHLFEGVAAALDVDGPALVHVHAPSPTRDGFAPEATVARARDAVAARVHPLLVYDPRSEGVFGARISLDGNPDVEAPWAADAEGQPVTPSRWAEGEARLRDGLSDEARAAWEADRASVWTTLQELAGVVTPFTRRIEERVAREVAEAHAAEVAALRAEHQRELAALRDSQLDDQATRLRERLLELAGPPAAPRGGNGAGGTP